MIRDGQKLEKWWFMVACNLLDIMNQGKLFGLPNQLKFVGFKTSAPAEATEVPSSFHGGEGGKGTTELVCI